MRITRSYVIDAEQCEGQADAYCDDDAAPFVQHLAGEVMSVLLDHPEVAGVRLTVEIEDAR